MNKVHPWLEESRFLLKECEKFVLRSEIIETFNCLLWDRCQKQAEWLRLKAPEFGEKGYQLIKSDIDQAFGLVDARTLEDKFRDYTSGQRRDYIKESELAEIAREHYRANPGELAYDLGEKQ